MKLLELLLLVWLVLLPALALVCGAFIRAGRGPEPSPTTGEPTAEADAPPLGSAAPDPIPDEEPSDGAQDDGRLTTPLAA